MELFRRFQKIFITILIAIMIAIGYVIYNSFFSSPKIIIRPTVTIIITDALDKKGNAPLNVEIKDFFRTFSTCFKDTLFIPFNDSRIIYLLDKKTNPIPLTINLIPELTNRKNSTAKNIDELNSQIEFEINKLQIDNHFYNGSTSPDSTKVRLIEAQINTKENRGANILIFSKDPTTKFVLLNNNKYFPYYTIDEIKKQRDSILCKNINAQIILIYDPPVIEFANIFKKDLDTIKSKISQYDSCNIVFFKCFPSRTFYPVKKKRLKAYSKTVNDFYKQLDPSLPLN